MVALAVLALGAAAAPPIAALQNRSGLRLENRMLRQASAQESRGELKEAEATLRELLEMQSGSSAAVLALERVLRADGRLTEVLPLFDRYIAEYPQTSLVWQHKLAVLTEVDSLAAVETTVDNWIRAAPGSPDPYRGGARALVEVAGEARAAELIEEGVEALGDLPLLLVELGEIELAAGRPGEAATAWARALGRDRARDAEVLRRVGELGDEREVVAEQIVAAMGTEPTTVARLAAGAELALREGIESEAHRLAAAVLARTGKREARGFLNGFAGQAEEAGLHGSAMWAYAELRELAGDSEEARQADDMLAAQALAAGDTATALEAMRRITLSYPGGTAERRTAWARALGVLVGSSDTEAAMEQLAAFKEEFPGADDLDALSATLASGLLGRGKRDEAMAVLSGIEGPGAALERAFLLLENGAAADAIAALQAALPDLEPSHATEILELTLALSELTASGASLAARAAVASHRGDPGHAVALVRDGVDQLPAPDRPAILALGARLADEAGPAEDAITFRRRIVAEHPDSREYPEAALRFALALAAEPGGRDEAVRILEALIVARPDSPVVPGARRELRRMRTGSSRPGGGGR